MSKVLLCSGFHRSATSATAHYLTNSGLDMGANLLEGNVSNINGHFEDIDIVKLHDLQLSYSNTSWKFHDECELRTKPGFLSSYIASRDSRSLVWGVKDPRAILFLDEWNATLGERGAFFFVARHWSGCIESLLNRHSRELAYTLNRNSSAQLENLSFWSCPQLAAKMWLSYNKRMLSFVKKHRSSSYLVTQRSLFEHTRIIEDLNERFDLQLDTGVSRPFDASLLHDNVQEGAILELSHSLVYELNDLWGQILEYAEAKGKDELSINVLAKTDVEMELVENSIFDIFKKYPLSEVNDEISLTEPSNFSVWLDDLNSKDELSDVINFLDGKIPNFFQNNNFNHDIWLDVVERKFFSDARVFVSSARLLMRVQAHHLALECIQKAITHGTYYPHLDMMKAQCYQFLGELDLADEFYQSAISGNSRNVVFYANYADFLLSKNSRQEALHYLRLGYNNSNGKEWILLKYLNLLIEMNLFEEAYNVGNIYLEDNSSEEVKELLSNKKAIFLTDVERYYKNVSKNIKGQDRMLWLARQCHKINSKNSEIDFISRCLSHWHLLDDYQI